MPFPLVVSGAAQLRLNWTVAGIEFNNVLGVVKPPGVTVNQALADTVGAAVKTAYTTSGMQTHQQLATGLTAVGLRDISSAGQPEYLDSGVVVVGTGTGDILPPQTALVVSVRTARSGASYRGRIYLGGFIEVDNEAAGQMSQAVATAAVAFIDGVMDALAANGMQLGVVSRPRQEKTIPAKVITAKTGFVTPASLVEVNNLLWDTQRRRTTSGGGSSLLVARGKPARGKVR